MNIRESTGYKNSLKKIKRNSNLQQELNKILSHIESIESFEELKDSCISTLYDFEVLRGDLSGYYKFSLNGNKTKYRLLFSYSNLEIVLEYISDEHYMDFKRYLRKL